MKFPSLLLAISTGLMVIPPVAAGDESPQMDLQAARDLFEKNLDAIRNRDRAAYLATYLKAETLARTGPEGFELGFDAHAAQSDDSTWPDRFEGLDLRLVRVRPGIVYGTYRYRVRYGEDEFSGLSERLFIDTAEGWRIAVTSAFAAPPGTPPPPRVLVGGTLIDGTGSQPVTDSVVVIRAGTIDCAGTVKECPVPDGVETLDVSGHWITPGLIDAHVHFSQTGWADGRPDAVDVRDLYPYEKVQSELRIDPERWFRSYLCSGVTAVFDVGGYPWTWGLREKAEPDTRAPHVAAAGPLLSTSDHWLNLPAERQFLYLSDDKSVRSSVDYLAAHHTSAIKVWFINRNEREFGEMENLVMLAGEESQLRGVPLIVHATGLREAKAAIRAGAHLLVHSVDDLPVDEEFLGLARDRGTIYCPTLLVGDGYRRLWESVLTGDGPDIDDPNGCVDSRSRSRLAETASLGADRLDREAIEARIARSRKRQEVMAENLEKIHAAGIPVAMGTDAGNPMTLHGPSVYAEMEAMQEAGMTPMEILVAATRTAARAMGREEDLGTIEAGKIADLLVVAKDPIRAVENLRAIRFVVRGGVIRSIDELRVSPSGSTE